MKKVALLLITFLTILLSGCSMHNPFGVGYDSSVCSESKTFGVCGAPKDIYKYKKKIQKVQQRYLKAKLDTVLYFAVSQEGNIQVKADRDGNWEDYESSDWKKLIDKRISLFQKKTKRNASFNVVDSRSDIPVTKGGDLSIKYQKQGPLLVTRTKIGNIIRDQGIIQEVFIANYADNDGDLISSHEVHVVVKNPEWVVGEKTPKNVNVESFPTPLSTDLLKKTQVVDMAQERTINAFNRDQEAGYLSAQENKSKGKNENIQDLSIIDNFIKESK